MAEYKKYLEKQGSRHRGSPYDCAMLSFYNGIMTTLDGIATAEDLEEYVNCMLTLVKAGADDIFYQMDTKGN